MNPFAYRTTGLAIKTLSSFLRARVKLHGGKELIPGPLIFVINHFTRIETLLMPYHIHRMIRLPVWSLADVSLFQGALGSFLDQVGAVSTKNPDRDRLIVRSLLTGEAAWIIFPEGRMVKNRKIVEKGRFVISYAGGKHPPHTGAASLALRTEFYRRRLRHMGKKNPEEAARLLKMFRIESPDLLHRGPTCIVPVNITYYPIRAKENLLSTLAARFVGNLPERFIEELMTEGSMLLFGVDVDVRFGAPIDVSPYLEERAIRRDIQAVRTIDFDDALPSLRPMRRAALKIMQRYMADIYSMTTINHDHLFAAMLRYGWFDRICAQDYRRKVLYLISRYLKEARVPLHKSLEESQYHLLTDDRYNRYGDFLSVAEEKGVLRQQGGDLIRDRSRFDSVFDLHRMRIDNPVAVMANEMEPLAGLMRRVRHVARMPSFWVRGQLAATLLRQAVAEFHADYGIHYAKGTSRPMQVGMPLLIRGGSRKTGVLLIHGYMAAPAEMAELARYLGDQGYWVYAPRLRGHGTSPEDLAGRTHRDWIESVERGYAVISSICREVVVGGFSTGAGLALDLACRVKNVKGLFAIAPPLRLQDFSARFVPAVDVWNRLMKKVRLEGAQVEFVENHPENPHINYRRNPISGIREIERLMESLEHRLPEIKVPALVAQASADPVVNPKGSKRIFDLLGSEDKQYLLFEFERHGILLGKGAWTVHAAIGHFLKGIGRDSTGDRR